MALTKLPGFTLDSTSSFTFANANVTANVSAGNILTNNLLYANGTAWTFGGTPGGSNTYVQFNDAGTFGGNSGFTFNKYSNTLTVGNITTGTGSGGNISGVNYVLANYVTGTLTTAAQPNITSVGTLSSVSVTSNVSAGNILTDNLLYANGVAWSFGSTYSNSNVASYLPTYTGNVAADYFIGNGSTLTHITGGNVDGQVGNSLVAGTVYTAAQPNITSVGTLTSLSVTNTITGGNLSTGGTLNAGDATITGNLTVNGTTITANTTTLNVKDPIIEMGGNVTVRIEVHYYIITQQLLLTHSWVGITQMVNSHLVVTSLCLVKLQHSTHLAMYEQVTS
jgi:hypothetical protein